MKILYLTQILPYPLDAGPKIRIYYVLRYLAQQHQVTLVSLVRGEKEAAYAEHLRTFCHQVYTVPIQRSRVRDVFFLLRSLTTLTPFLIVRDEVAQMDVLLADLMRREKFDAVHADQLGMAQFALKLNGIRRVLDQHNAVWTIVHRLYQNAGWSLQKPVMWLETRKLKQYEAEVCRQFDHVFTVTEEDKIALQSLDAAHPLPMTVMPICIDPETLPRVQPNANAQDIICVGGMFYPPNVDAVLWFAREVFPHIKSVKPNARFLIVGARPDPRIIELGKLDPQICVLGYVEDVTPHLASSAVFIAPIRAGGGMRVKILDAWSRGIPIVSTTIGCEGIQVRPGENILVADQPRDFADAVLSVLNDATCGKQLADNGRAWVEDKYNWRTVYSQLDTVYGK